MKLVRHGLFGQENAGIVDSEGHVRDLSKYILDLTPKYLADVDLLSDLRKLNLQTLPVVSPATRIGACVGEVGKAIFIGYNSLQHAKEMGIAPQTISEPIVFMKPSSVIMGPYDPIVYTRSTKKLDWEAELAIIIGKKGKYIPLHEASNYILGYACSNDLSDRYLQFETFDKQFTKGKCFDGAARIGPYLVTKDEVDDSRNLHIKLSINGELRQDFKTEDYVYNDEKIVSFLSQYFTLHPGDIISMGSAPGSAKAWGDSFLKPGDLVELTITGLGEQRQLVVRE